MDGRKIEMKIIPTSSKAREKAYSTKGRGEWSSCMKYTQKCPEGWVIDLGITGPTYIFPF